MRRKTKLVAVFVLAILISISVIFVTSLQDTENQKREGVREVLGDDKVEPVSTNRTLGRESFNEVSKSWNFSYRIEGEHDTEGFPAGVYVSDYNRDGQEDLLAVSEDNIDLFRNTGSSFSKSNVLPQINASITSAHFFDYDNDGWEDLYLLSNERSVFLENNRGTFEKAEVGLEVSYDSVRGAATADYSGDGCADVFVVQSGDWQNNRPDAFLNTSVGIEEENGNRNRLFGNTCSQFNEKTEEAGIRGGGWSLATSFVDFTNDGLPDIHVANDFNRDVLYINNGNGTFMRRVLPKYTNRNGMSSEVLDINNDGLTDIFITNIYEKSRDYSYGVRENRENVKTYRFGRRTKGNNLLLSEGGGEFIDVAEEYGVRKMPGWGWSAIATDFQNDGLVDIFHAVDSEGAETPQPLWVGKGDRFRNTGFIKTEFGSVAARSASSLDFNSDGGIDIAVGALNGPYQLYMNDMDRDRYVQIVVEGNKSQTALGTEVQVITGESEQIQTVNSGSDYMSQDTRVLHFGVNEPKRVDIRVERPDGVTQEFSGVQTDNRFIVSYDGIRETD